jgi:hypothetical protein
MPVYLDTEPRDDASSTTPACDWQVVHLMRGRVSLMSGTSLSAPAMGCVFTFATLPQLRQVVALLEKDAATS